MSVPAAAIAEEAARAAGVILLERFGSERALDRTKSSPTDLVSEADLLAEKAIRDVLEARAPDDAIMGEEGTDTPGTSGVRWVIDPLDGTTNYFYGVPAYAVSIAVEVDGDVVAGVVADPSRHETFTAVRGGGATCNGRPIACSQATVLGHSLIGTGFSYEPDRRARQGAVVGAVLPVARDVRRFGAAALDLCWVGCGRLDGYYEKGLQAWDLAAGALIAAEAGAIVGDLSGGPASTAFALASAPAIFDELRSLLAGAGAGEA